MFRTIRVTQLATLLVPALLVTPAAAQLLGLGGVTELVSLDGSGLPVGSDCTRPSISEDGRYVAFQTAAALVAADANGLEDVYVVDRQTGQVACASITATGVVGDGASSGAVLSADGRYVAFSTLAGNLQSLDVNGLHDVYRKDLWTGDLERVSDAWLSPFAAAGTSTGASISDDGSRVVFESSAPDLVASDTNGFTDVFVRDLQTGLTQRVSDGVWGQANGNSFSGRISGDGTHFAFVSLASNLVLFDDNGLIDVFLVQPGKNPKLVSRNTTGNPGNGHSVDPRLSADGSLLVFESAASDLSPLDVNGVSNDVFLYDTASASLELVSLDDTGAPSMHSVQLSSFSRDGRLVAMASSHDLAPGAGTDRQVYLRDLELGRTVCASRPSGTVSVPDDEAGDSSLALGGSLVAFASAATNLVSGDANGVADVFVRAVHADPFEYCSSSVTSQGCLPRITPFGHSSVSGQTELTLLGDELPNRKTGILFYGFDGQAANPWGGGTMCIQGSKERTPLMSTAGNLAGNDCSGFFGFDLGPFAAGALGGNPKPELSVVGQRVNVQFWGRDPLLPSGTFLSTAVEYVVGP